VYFGLLGQRGADLRYTNGLDHGFRVVAEAHNAALSVLRMRIDMTFGEELAADLAEVAVKAAVED